MKNVRKNYSKEYRLDWLIREAGKRGLGELKEYSKGKVYVFNNICFSFEKDSNSSVEHVEISLFEGEYAPWNWQSFTFFKVFGKTASGKYIWLEQGVWIKPIETYLAFLYQELMLVKKKEEKTTWNDDIKKMKLREKFEEMFQPYKVA